MNAAAVVGIITLCLTALFAWSFRHLTRERWQILATLPLDREPDGAWRGTNLTYYGVFNALGVAASLAVAIFLPGTVQLPFGGVLLSTLAILAICIPASKIVNRLVEGHWHGFTIGGASFVGIMVGPGIFWMIWRLVSPVGCATAAMYVLSAIASAYALGEGIGRLACISFGCCYGRRLADCPGWLQKLFFHGAFVFEGRLKKASYANGFEGERLVPVQAMTAVLSTSAGLLGITLFLSGRPAAAYILTIVMTQTWRFVSEFLREDYRGEGRISAYQRMALASAACTLIAGLFWPDSASARPDVARGLSLLWTPGVILFIEATAIFVFIRMGRSTVTTSRIAFDLTPAAHTWNSRNVSLEHRTQTTTTDGSQSF